MLRILMVMVLALIGGSLAQDELQYDPVNQTLSYSLDYDRLKRTADSRGCRADSFDSGLLHLTLHSMFLYLPYEASFYDTVRRLEFKLVSDALGKIVLRAEISSSEVRQTNSRFRSFINGFASVRSNECFAVDQMNLESWMTTLKTRGGLLEYDPEVISVQLRDADVMQVAQSQPQINQEYRPLAFVAEEARRNFRTAELVIESGKDYVAIIETTKGSFEIDLLEDEAAVAVNNFVFLATHRFFEGLGFFRVEDDFIAQFGDPLNTGFGGPGYELELPLSPVLHDQVGIISMAQSGTVVNGSQFIISLVPLPQFNGQHSAFARVSHGLEVLEALQRSDIDEPLALAPLDSPVTLLRLQGISVPDSDMSIREYLEASLGEVPAEGRRTEWFDLDVLVSPSQIGQSLQVALWPKADRILKVTVYERDK